MTLFEFLTVAISIVLALSAGQLLTNVREVFDPTRRYWVHALWVIHLLFQHVLVWWSFWAYRDVESWNLATFGIALLPTGLLFVCTSTLVPSYSSTVAILGNTLLRSPPLVLRRAELVRDFRGLPYVASTRSACT